MDLVIEMSLANLYFSHLLIWSLKSLSINKYKIK